MTASRVLVVDDESDIRELLREILSEERLLDFDEQITEQLTAEVEQYSQWVSGQCYGYVITDSNGDEVVSCWGYIGYKDAKESASSAVPTKPESAIPLYPVRLTAQQLTSLGLPVPA